MKSIIGLDIGSTEFRSVRHVGSELLARKVPAVYCVVEDDLCNRRLLDQSQIQFAQAKGALIVIGESAYELSALIRCPLIPVIWEGHLPWQDPIGRQVCSILVDALLPQVEPNSAICTLTLPSSAAKGVHSQRSFLEQMIALRGYRSTLLNPATAVVLSELQEAEFSGMGVVVGAESIALSLCQFGQPIFEGVYGQGFRSIEQRFSLSRHRYLWDYRGNKYLDLQTVQNWLQQAEISLSSPKSGDELWLVQQFSKLLADAWNSMLPDLIRVGKQGVFKKRLSLVVAGGTTRQAEFPQLLEYVMHQQGLPIRLREILSTQGDPYAVSRGLLLHSALISEASYTRRGEAA